MTTKHVVSLGIALLALGWGKPALATAAPHACDNIHAVQIAGNMTVVFPRTSEQCTDGTRPAYYYAHRSGPDASYTPITRRPDGAPSAPDRRPVVFVGPYEHHSNEVSWRMTAAEVVTLPEDAAGHT